MKKYPVALQLYSLREEAKKSGLVEILKQTARAGYAGVEFAGLHNVSPKDVRKALDDLGLKACSAHGAAPVGDNITQIVDQAKEIGYAWHVCGFGSKLLVTEDDCRRSADILQAGAAALEKHGIRVAMHNHWWEFDKKFNGKYPYQILMDSAPDVCSELDTYWTAVGGADVLSIINSYKSRIPLMHIKDGPINREQPMTAVGGGKMDWKAVIGAASDKTTEWLIVELDRCGTDMYEAVCRSCEYLVGNGFGVGRA